jgi:hypothetical protein
MSKFLSLFFLVFALPSFAQEECATPDVKLAALVLKNSDSIFATLDEAIEANTKVNRPLKFIDTLDSKHPKFPSYSACKLSFFRVATIDKTVDGIINQDGWKSGWSRREDELKKNNLPITEDKFDALPKSSPMEDRIVEYVRVKNVPSTFPKNSTVVGVLENPIRTFSVGYHTGYNQGMAGNHMRMDEIEVGPCARAPECQRLKAYDSSKVFADKKLEPRYSTEGEWAVDTQIPSACVVATYRIKFQKVDEKCYSDANANCNF